MASELAALSRTINTGQMVAYHSKLLDFTNVRNVKFIFNPFHERVASVRFVIPGLAEFAGRLGGSILQAYDCPVVV